MYFNLSKIFCTLFGLGFISKMPGTIGSIVGVLFYILAKPYLSLNYFVVFLFLVILLSFLTIYIYQLKRGKEDRKEIIIDEFIGQIITMIFLEYNFLNLLLAFILFRFFDIVKIFPANYIDKNYSGCFGIVLDDIVAAFQAIIIILFINVYII